MAGFLMLQLEKSKRATVIVNGRVLTAEIEPRTLLIDVLRREGGLTGPRIGCEEGACGACTVKMNGVTVKSCLVLALEAEGATVDTVESLGTAENLSPLQAAFKDCHAVQCGYCAAGMLMSAEALLHRHVGKKLTDEMIRDGMMGNICRCTGYANIIHAIKVAAGQAESLSKDADAAGGQYIGRSRPRVEDNRLLSGGGRYVDAFNEAGQQHMAVVPSRRAHAKIKTISIEAALKRAGVFAVMTGKDAAKVAKPMAPSIDMAGIRLPKQLPIAVDKVVFYGEPVAVILAETPEIAEDAIADVIVDYEDLPPAVNMEMAAELKEGDPGLLYPDWGTNLQTDYPFSMGDVDGKFANAACVVQDKITSQRYGAQPLETRAVLAKFDPREGTLVVRASTQVPHQAKMWLSRVLSIPESKLQVIVGDVGGGFGAKLAFDAEYLPAIASKIYGVPVKWIEPREGWIISSTQARDFIARTRAAFDAKGKLLAVDTDVMGDVGCDGAERACGIGMPINGALYVTSAYEVDTMRFRARAVVTNKPPYGAYRGYGKDIANMTMERMMDRAAEKLGIDPIEIRRLNTVGKYPYQLPSGPILETGSNRECLDQLISAMDLPALRRMQAEAQRNGRYVGVGISSYIEPAGAAFPGTFLQNYESASIRVNADGSVRAYTGIVSIGQGIETAYGQVVADLVGCRPEDVSVYWGDTNVGPFGSGTYSSRGAMYAVGAFIEAGARVKGRLLHAASKLLDLPIDDITLKSGIVTSRSSNKTCTLKDIAYAVYYQPGSEIVLDGADGNSLEAVGDFRHPQVNWKVDAQGRAQLYPSHPNGAQGALVEVDVDTGEIRIIKMWLVSDHGVVLNPMILDGQITGSLLQQVGGTLYEQNLFDEQGRPLTRTLKEYGMPTIWTAPDLEISHYVTKSPATSIGAKGAGEDGSVGTTTVLLAAVEDALKTFGVRVSCSPLTPWNVRKLIEEVSVVV
jgi:carbon-monoxide dehydrogenase large subunit